MPTAARPWDTTAPGQTWRGWWETGGAGLPAVPVLAARGAAPGPVLAVTGGVHGDEYEGPAAIHALFERLDVARLRGLCVGVPVVNVAAWEARSRVTPLDGVNLNRVFPGGRGSEPSCALAEAVFAAVVRRCDVLVDLHSGGAALVHLPLVGWYAGGEGQAEGLARGFGTALHPWLVPDVPGVLSYEAHRAGTVAVAAEWGGGARLDPAGAAAYTSGVQHVMTELSMLPRPADARPSLQDARRPIAGDYQETEVGGLFIPRVRLGDTVDAGQVLGDLYDPTGAIAAAVPAARAGIVAGLPHLALLHAGDRVAYIG